MNLLVSLALSGLGRNALKVAGGLSLAVLISLAFAISSLTPFTGIAAPGNAVISAHADEIPPDQLRVMQEAAATCGVPWQILAAIAKVESGFGQNMATSSAGAIGYGQFLPSTWVGYGNGGNPYDYHDALPAMARYLCASGAPGDLRSAMFAYNHSWAYVDQVMAIAIRYGYGQSSAPGNRVVELARSQIGMPYVWGASDPHVGFDCSGLVMWVYAQVGVSLPRTAQAQYDGTSRVSQADLQPGDLVFFANTYPSAEPITHVGIYVGDGLMVNAENPTDGVQEMPVFTGYWAEHYAGAGRVGG